MPSLPRSYQGRASERQSVRLLWDSATVEWSNYANSVRSFLASNGVTNLPSDEVIQDFMCQGAPAVALEIKTFTRPRTSLRRITTNPARPAGNGTNAN